MRRTLNPPLVRLLLAVTVLVVGACDGSGNARQSTQSTGQPAEQASSTSVLTKFAQEKVLRIGFSGYPPFLNVDPNTKQPVDGFSVELIRSIVQQWDSTVTIQWIPTNWTNVRVDLIAGKFDLVVEPVFQTIPRAAVVDFSRPYSYFGYAVGLVRINDNRFDAIEDLNSPEVRIAVMQGGSAHEYVQKNLPRATNLKVLPTGNVESSLDEVLLSRVDITLADYHTIKRYIDSHPGRVRAVFVDPPPGRVAAGFMFRQDDYRWASFLNTALQFMETSGEIRRLKEKYNVE
jgi:polar amino acid transport system substrate-binding protein